MFLIILARFLTLLLIWPIIFGFRASWFTMCLILAWWITLLVLLAKLTGVI